MPVPDRMPDHANAHAKQTIRVGIVDDDPLTLYVLRAIVRGMADQYGITVVWAVRSGDVAVSRCIDADSRPDILLVDMNMDDVDGGMVCQRIRRFSGDIAIYAMTSHSLRRYENIACRFGAQALLDKADAEGLRRCLTDYAQGVAYIQHGFDTPQEAYRRLSPQRSYEQAGLLSPREIEVLDWTIEGLTAKEVAKRMALSESTVKTHIRHAITKLNVENKLQLIRVWTQHRNTSSWHTDHNS